MMGPRKVAQGALHLEPGYQEDLPPCPRSRIRRGPPHCDDRRLCRCQPTTKESRDALRPPQTHPPARRATPPRTQRRKRRVPPRSNCPEPPETGEDPSHTAETAKRLTRKAPAPITSAKILRSRTGDFPQNRLFADIRRLCSVADVPQGPECGTK